MKRLLLLLVVLMALPAPAYAADGPQVIVLGVPGLRWSDVNERDMPALTRLQAAGASGVLSVKTAAARDCPTDGWLTLAAGNRVVAAGPREARCPAAFPPASTLPAQVGENADRREGAQPGLLAAELGRAGRCVEAAGAGARLAAAAPDGTVAIGSGGMSVTLLGNAAALPACDVLLVEGTPVGGERRAGGAAAADALTAKLSGARAASSTLIVVGLSEAPGDVDPHLHVAVAVGPGFGPGSLISASTRRAPYVQLVDVAPTILHLLGLPTSESMIGEPWRAVGGAPSVASLRDEATKADAQRTVTVPWFVVVLGLEVLVLGLSLWRRWWRTAEVAALAGTCAVGASYLANAVPWWHGGLPTLLAVTAGVTAGLTLLALLGRGLLARAGIACGLVALVLVGDLLTGARLQMSSVAGYSPLVAGRFAGIGNVAFGVLAASVLLAAASTRSPTVAALTALVVIVDGAPQWGSDVGGVLALVPAYAVLVLLLAGRAASLGRVALAALVGALVVTAFAIADHARPPNEQTHLGRFVGQVLDGSAGDVVRRKAEANVALLFHSPLTALLPLVVAGAVVLFLRPPGPLLRAFEASPAWRAGLLAVLTASGLGFVLNDSGTAVPALAIVVAVPATLAVLARSARLGAPPG
jgi:hypothetical protein